MFEVVQIATMIARLSGGPTELAVSIDGFRNAQGVAVLQLHDSSGAMFHDPPLRRLEATIRDGRAFFVFHDVASRRLALFGFHDRNHNGILDHNWMRFPAEPMTFSNRFRPGLIAGMPNFAKLAIPIHAPYDTIHLTVQ